MKIKRFVIENNKAILTCEEKYLFFFKKETKYIRVRKCTDFLWEYSEWLTLDGKEDVCILICKRFNKYMMLKGEALN